MHIIISIQPAGKPVEHLTNSFELLYLIMEKKIEAINADLISNNGGGGGTSEKRGSREVENKNKQKTENRISERAGLSSVILTS